MDIDGVNIMRPASKCRCCPSRANPSIAANPAPRARSGARVSVVKPIISDVRIVPVFGEGVGPGRAREGIHATAKDDPQPQVVVALGLRITKRAPWRFSS